jgi:hypothetical protein
MMIAIKIKNNNFVSFCARLPIIIFIWTTFFFIFYILHHWLWSSPLPFVWMWWWSGFSHSIFLRYFFFVFGKLTIRTSYGSSFNFPCRYKIKLTYFVFFFKYYTYNVFLFFLIFHIFFLLGLLFDFDKFIVDRWKSINFWCC